MRGLGRINRATYWLVVAGILAVAMVVGYVTRTPFRGTDVLLLIVAIPRLHDFGRSAWWAVAVLLLEFLAGVALAKLLPAPQLPVSIGMIAIVIAALTILVGFLRGTAGTNRFGPQPAPGISYSAPQISA
jgi:uncharacterized membrane protein YhaH (DUF805 family)